MGRDLISYLVDKKKKIVESTTMSSSGIGTWRGFGWTVGPSGHPLVDTIFLKDIKQNRILPIKEITDSSVTAINGKYIKLSELVESKDYELVDAEKKIIQVDKNKKVDLGEAKKDPKAGVRNRGKVVFTAESPKVKDDKDHFPIGDIGHARNALSRMSQYKTVPTWYKGSLSALKNAIKRAVKKAFPSIEVSESAFLKENKISLELEPEEIKNDIKDGIAPDFNKDGEEAQIKKLVEDDDEDELKLDDEEEEAPEEAPEEGEEEAPEEGEDDVEGEMSSELPAGEGAVADAGPVADLDAEGEEEVEKEETEEVPPISKKMLFGVNNSGDISYSIEPVFKGEETLDDIVVKDQEGKQVWSAKESGDVDLNNSTQVILRVVRDLDVMITKDLFMTYLYEPLIKDIEKEEAPEEEAPEEEAPEEEATKESIANAYKEAKDAIAEFNKAKLEEVKINGSRIEVILKKLNHDQLMKLHKKWIANLDDDELADDLFDLIPDMDEEDRKKFYKDLGLKYDKVDEKISKSIKGKEKKKDKLKKKAQKAIDKYNKAKDKWKAAKAKEDEKEAAKAEKKAAKKAPKEDAEGEVEESHEDIAEAKNSADAAGKAMGLTNIEKGEAKKTKKDKEALNPKQEKADESIEVEHKGNKFAVSLIKENVPANMTMINLNGVEFGFGNEFVMDVCGLKEAKLEGNDIKLFAEKVLDSMDEEQYTKLIKKDKN
jgi:hypothetical protein